MIWRFIASLGAVYGPFSFSKAMASVHRTVFKAFKRTVNLRLFLFWAVVVECKLQRYWRVEKPFTNQNSAFYLHRIVLYSRIFFETATHME